MKPKTLRRTKIEWTDYSWNPIRARNRKTGKTGWHCDHASEGCRHCYAETLNKLYGTGLAYSRQNTEKVEVYLDYAWLEVPMPYQPSKVFVGDMTDIFGEFVEVEWIDTILGVTGLHPEHIYQLLTKRPERMRDYFALPGHGDLPMPNAWLGTSIETRRHLDRLDALRATPAVLRFVSFEPLLEDLGTIDLTGISWVIVGAESDPRGRARSMQLDWVRNIRDQCTTAGVPFFFKQDAVRGKKLPLPELDGRQWREFPAAGAALMMLRSEIS